MICTSEIIEYSVCRIRSENILIAIDDSLRYISKQYKDMQGIVCTNMFFTDISHSLFKCISVMFNKNTDWQTLHLLPLLRLTKI